MPYVACSLEQNPKETVARLEEGIGKILNQGLFSGRSMLSIYEDFLEKLLGPVFLTRYLICQMGLQTLNWMKNQN